VIYLIYFILIDLFDLFIFKRGWFICVLLLFDLLLVVWSDFLIVIVDLECYPKFVLVILILNFNFCSCNCDRAIKAYRQKERVRKILYKATKKYSLNIVRVCLKKLQKDWW